MQSGSDMLTRFVQFLPAGHFVAERPGGHAEFGSGFGLVPSKAFDSRQDDHALDLVQWQRQELRR